MVNPSSRMVALFRVLRIVILIRIFRLASQKKQLEVVTRRMVSWSSNKSRQLLLFLIIFFSMKPSIVRSKTTHSVLV